MATVLRLIDEHGEVFAPNVQAAAAAEAVFDGQYRQAAPAPGEVVERISNIVFDESDFGEPDLEEYAD